MYLLAALNPHLGSGLSGSGGLGAAGGAARCARCAGRGGKAHQLTPSWGCVSAMDGTLDAARAAVVLSPACTASCGAEVS